MPQIQPDLSAVGPIQPGTYEATITACEVKTSKAGNPKIVPTFSVTVAGESRTRQSHLVTSGSGAYGFGQLLRAAGFGDLADQYEDPDQPNPPFDTDELIGVQLNVVIEENMYEGQMRDQIKSYLKA